MVTKKDLIRVARKGNSEHTHYDSEERCSECGEYEWKATHKEDCALGALLRLIEKHVKDD